MEVPSTEWLPDAQNTVGEQRSTVDLLKQAPVKAKWKKRVGEVRHTFTHFHLVLGLYEATIGQREKLEGEWVRIEDLGDHALPTVMKKVIDLALSTRTQ